MAAQKKELNSRDIRELDNALTVARLACRRVQHKVPYAGNLYDAVDDLIYAINKMAKETRDVT